MAKNQNNNVAPATQKTEPGAKKDALATALAQIEKQFGKGAIMKLGDNTAMQVDAISTGSLGLDLALGVGGVPRGRIIEVFGPESSGKTTLALHILAEAQKKSSRLEDRGVIEKAKGLVMAEQEMTEQQAYDYIRGLSLTKHLSMRKVSEMLLRRSGE